MGGVVAAVEGGMMMSRRGVVYEFYITKFPLPSLEEIDTIGII